MSEARCRSCGELILWILLGSKDPEKPARPHPVDAVPKLDGNIQLRTEGSKRVGRIIPRVDGGRLYVSHFATCPNARAHRKAKPATKRRAR